MVMLHRRNDDVFERTLVEFCCGTLILRFLRLICARSITVSVSERIEEREKGEHERPPRRAGTHNLET